MKYIKNAIRNTIRTVMIELLKEPESKLDLQEYIVKRLPKKELNAFDIMKSPYCTEIKLKIKYKDHNNFPGEVYLDKPPKEFWEQLAGVEVPDDTAGIETVELFARYTYKENKDLVIHNFTSYGKTYNPDILEKVKVELMTWYNKHPELKL